MPPAAPRAIQPRFGHGTGLRRLRLVSTVNSREGRALAADRGGDGPERWVHCGQLTGKASRWQFSECRGDSGAVMVGIAHHPLLSLVLQDVAREVATQLGEARPPAPGNPDAVVVLHDTPGTHRAPAVVALLGPILEMAPGWTVHCEHLAVSFTSNACQCARLPARQGRWCSQVARQCGRNPDSEYQPRETVIWLHNEQHDLRTQAILDLAPTVRQIFQAAGL